MHTERVPLGRSGIVTSDRKVTENLFAVPGRAAPIGEEHIIPQRAYLLPVTP